MIYESALRAKVRKWVLYGEVRSYSQVDQNFHLTGDAHQPMHSCALLSTSRIPKGDRGGNEIPLMQGKNLHSLWDNLLGRQDRLNDVQIRTAELSDRDVYGDVWASAAKETDVRRWLVESFMLAKGFAYDDAILQVVRRATPSQPLERITLSDDYLKSAGDHARRRVLVAGLRLAVVLHDYDHGEAAEADFDAGAVRPQISTLTAPD
jgi:hypothetical protein